MERMINPAYAKPIIDLANLCTEDNIPCTINTIYDGFQIRFPWNNGDMVCHGFSYGHAEGYVESYGCPWDEGDVTCLSVTEAYINIACWYKETEG